MTNRRPSLGLPNLKSISVPPRSAIDTGTCSKDRYNLEVSVRKEENFCFSVIVQVLKQKLEVKNIGISE